MHNYPNLLILVMQSYSGILIASNKVYDYSKTFSAKLRCMYNNWVDFLVERFHSEKPTYNML